MHSERRRGRQRSKILYWFRTPPGVKIGRTALDEEAIRQIEALNPDLEFDWPRILKGQGAPPTEPRTPPDLRRRRGDSPTGQSTLSVPALEAPAPTIPADEEPAHEQPTVTVPTQEGPALDRLGAEGLQRLRSRYAEIVARINERTSDPTRREELRASAERLNPDAWLTADDVTRGLEEYETVFASLRQLVGHRRRRRRRGRREAAGADAPAIAAGTDGVEGSADSEGENQDDSSEPPDETPEGESGSGEL